MRWKSNKPQHYGQHRHKTKFLLFPKKLGDEWRWLEEVTFLQRVDVMYNLGDRILYWQDVKWIDKEKKKKNI
ncbi:hypothetical protein PQE74_gp154 [Bacillus phage vB_BanS_Chewbecca]|uniref:Uncharacterized protein n=2 Tax=Tsamsavirus TaxID=3044849 RepID=A0AAE8YQD5_9CAUD|nr:hypothetical protein PQE73_gp163 [Bacillus phage vB_BanS_MrDarsey]YP_010681297.1 hypothetical protein PQE74_gp154 [Bacillus phage vB_BanS_Chewbecca]UGO46237.1 hypothetical protein CHEWBECCA_154 [Bacillus phage vB_BanS_Chewbecca]UGO47995.1 hypothetical protein MRDARSEY_163 [Bacillus phage vB_BanS_MrDarsey]